MFTKSKKHNENYLTRFVQVTSISDHPNADRLKLLHIDGNTIITGVDTKVGDYVVYFPLESALSFDFLKYSNSFEDKASNADTSVKGFFGKQGRVRAVKLRGAPSMGYCVPVASFFAWVSHALGETFVFNPELVGTEFDTISYKNKEIFVSKKYVNYQEKKQQAHEKRLADSKYKAQQQSKLVENQFRLHCDTAPLAKNMFKVNPNDFITISAKLHGTSAVFANILCQRQLKWYEKLLVKCGIKLARTVYDNVYSSRKVIKNRYYNDKEITDGFYGTDIWGVVNKEVKDLLPKGVSVYGEIVGYLPDGGMVQKDYDYGCERGQHTFYVYRVTMTNPDGQVVEYSTQQAKDFCDARGLKFVPILYQGFAKDLFNIDVSNHWHDEFLNKMKETYLEKDDPLCKNKVPDEGICLRQEASTFEVMKLKSFRFFERETKQLDSGEVDIESAESTNDSE